MNNMLRNQESLLTVEEAKESLKTLNAYVVLAGKLVIMYYQSYVVTQAEAIDRNEIFKCAFTIGLGCDSLEQSFRSFLAATIYSLPVLSSSLIFMYVGVLEYKEGDMSGLNLARMMLAMTELARDVIFLTLYEPDAATTVLTVADMLTSISLFISFVIDDDGGAFFPSDGISRTKMILTVFMVVVIFLPLFGAGFFLFFGAALPVMAPLMLFLSLSAFGYFLVNRFRPKKQH